MKIHVYNVNGQPYTSAAEVVSAILSKQPIEVVCHSVTTDIHGTLLSAISRAVGSLRYSLAQNIHAGLCAAAVLILLYWPVIYNAISLAEVTLAARIASGVCAGLSFLAALAAGTQIRKLIGRSSVTNNATVTYRDDNLLPRATAWRQDRRHIAFPWLGLGLILFAIALNCVVVGNYAHPAILNDGTVHHSVGLVPPWATWENTTRYLEDSFFVPYYHDETTDEFYVLRVTYRVENTDLITLPPTGWKSWLINICGRMVNYAAENLPADLSASATEEDVALALSELFEYNEYQSSFIDVLETQWAERYSPGLRLTYIDYELLIVTRTEAAADYDRHTD